MNPRSGSSHHHLLSVAFNISAKCSLMSSALAPPTRPAAPTRLQLWPMGASLPATPVRHKAFHCRWCQNPNAATQQRRAGRAAQVAGHKPLVWFWNETTNIRPHHISLPHHRQESDHFQRRPRAPVKLDIQSRGSVSVGFPINNNNVFLALWVCWIRTTSHYITQCSPNSPAVIKKKKEEKTKSHISAKQPIVMSQREVALPDDFSPFLFLQTNRRANVSVYTGSQNQKVFQVKTVYRGQNILFSNNQSRLYNN